MKSDFRPDPASPSLEGAIGLSLGQALRSAGQALSAIEFGRLTAEALVAHVLGLSRAQLLSRLEQPFPHHLKTYLDRLIERAADGEPLAYLTGQREFSGLDFRVDARVLVPRPETEQLVELAVKHVAGPPPAAGWRIWDVGTGSGILAITLALKCPAAQVVASDLSADALAVAQANARQHGVAGRVHFVHGDLLSACARGWVDLLLANLPYIPSAALRDLPVFRHEPRLALDGGGDGLELYRRLLTQAPHALAPGGRMLLEIEDTCGQAAVALAQSAFPAASVSLHPDLAGLDRVVEVRL
jgi:release factor glutamine methyltransferase